jgi:hypothetical protein
MVFDSYKAIYTSHTIISAMYKTNLDFLDRGEVISNIFFIHLMLWFYAQGRNHLVHDRRIGIKFFGGGF